MRFLTLTVLALMVACGKPGPEEAPGEYGLVSLTTRFEDSTRTVNAGVDGTFGTLNIRHGGRIDGELGRDGEAQPLLGTWYFADSALVLSGDSFGGSINAMLRRDGSLSFAVPISQTRSDPYTIAMKSDLRNLVSAEESFFSDSAKYTSSLRALGFNTSSGVTSLRIVTGAGKWQATVHHERLPSVVCGIAVNAENPIDPLASEGEPRCSNPPARIAGQLTVAWKRVR